MSVGQGYGGVNVFRIVRTVLTAGAASLALALASQAATINEGSAGFGEFSGLFFNPTVIANGNDIVTGSLSLGDYDYLLFNRMNPGASSVALTITGPAGRYVAQGRVYYSTTPFSLTNAGTLAGNIRVTPGQPAPPTITFNLNSSFAGSLYLSLNLSLGPVMRYSVSVPGNVDIPGIPLPASALMLGGALAGLGGFASRRAKRGAA